MLIGLIGKKGAGKDTFADLLQKEISLKGLKMERRQMAYNLKKACALTTDMPFFNFEDNKIKNSLYERPLPVTIDFLMSFLNNFGVSADTAAGIYEFLKDKNHYHEVNSNRELLQYLGTDILRDLVGPNVHIDSAVQNLDKNSVYVFTDIRFENETKIKKSFDKALFIGIKRNLNNHDNHPSEAGIDSLINNYADVVVDNNKTIKELKETASLIVQRFF